jgi:hypothetical protein
LAAIVATRAAAEGAREIGGWLMSSQIGAPTPPLKSLWTDDAGCR